MHDEHDAALVNQLTPLMRALLQAADCLLSPEPIPVILLLAPLVPRAMAEGRAALALLKEGGWLVAVSPDSVELTAQSRAFLATRHSDEDIQAMVIQGLCLSATRLSEAHDEAMLRLVLPHLQALAEARYPRGDRYALDLSLAMSIALVACGSPEQAQIYLERARALDYALGTTVTRPRFRWWGRR